MIIDDDDHETHHQVVQKDFELTDVIRGKWTGLYILKTIYLTKYRCDNPGSWKVDS